MKIQAQHVFYLDFQLPDFHDSNGCLPLGIRHNGKVAIIAPWDHKGELFDGELGQTLQLAEFSLASVAQSSGRLVKRVADIAIDGLMVVIEWDHDGDLAGDDRLIQLRLEEAVTYANFFISHLRAVTGSTHVNRIEVYWNPEDKTFQVQVPHHVKWIDTETNSALPIYQGMNSLFSLGGIRVSGGGTVEWDDMRKSMSTGTLPAFHRTLLVDARDALTTTDIRAAILSIASACEVRIKQYAETQTMITGTQAKQIIKTPQLSFAKRHFDLLPSRTCGRSLSDYNAELFEDVQSCYSQRNHLIHGGELLSPLDGMGIADRLRTVSQWLLSAENAIAWVDSLPTVSS